MLIKYICKVGMMRLEPKHDIAVISIGDPSDPYMPTGWWLDVLKIKCHDITSVQEKYIAFGDEQAAQVIDFVTRHKDSARGFVVHCEAGVSRSGAVAHFIASFLGKDYVDNDHNLEKTGGAPFINRHIYEMLMKKTGLLLKSEDCFVMEGRYFISGDSDIYVLKVINDTLFHVRHSASHQSYSFDIMQTGDLDKYSYRQYDGDWIDQVTYKLIGE